MKIPKNVRKLAENASKHANLHRINRQEFEDWLEYKGIDIEKLINHGGDEFSYVDSIGYGLSNPNWEKIEKGLEYYLEIKDE